MATDDPGLMLLLEEVVLEDGLGRLEDGLLSCEERFLVDDDVEDDVDVALVEVPSLFVTRCFALRVFATSVVVGKCHCVCLLNYSSSWFS